MMLKIVMACLYNQETNLGDKAYVETFCTLINKYSLDVNVVICDLFGRGVKYQNSNGNSSQTIKKKNWKIRIVNILPEPCLAWLYEKLKYRWIKRYYEKEIAGANAVIIPGGGLVEYSSFRVFHLLIEKLEEACMKMHIPLYLNSLGYVENENSNNWFKRWKKILNSPCIRHFTCRDNLPIFLKLNASVTQVPCIACLVADALKIKRDRFDNNTIGIGLMRYNCYSDYGKNVSKEFLLDYYFDVIIELRRIGYKIALFSTGVQLDHAMGNDIIKLMEQRCSSAKGITLLPRPVEVQDLVTQISHFRGILTVRTHSAYTAFSLNVPTLMMHFGKNGWARKAVEFMKMMGRPENAVCCDNLSPVALVEKFCNAMDLGWDQKVRKEKKNLCLQNFFTVMNKIGVKASSLDSHLTLSIQDN